MQFPIKHYKSDSGLFSVRDAANGRIAVDLTEQEAQFIVTACNVHDQLLAALKELTAAVERKASLVNNRENWTSVRIEDALVTANAALTAAGAT